MYNLVSRGQMGLAVVLLVLVILAALAARKLERSTVDPARRARRVRRLLLIAAAVLVVRIAVTVRLALWGWWFAAGPVLGAALLLVPGFAVAALAWPRLGRIARRSGSAAGPAVQVPLQLLVAGSLLDGYVTTSPPVPPLGQAAVRLFAILAAVAAVLFLWRVRWTSSATAADRGVVVLASRRFAGVAIVVLLAAGVLGVQGRTSVIPEQLHMAGMSGPVDYGGGPGPSGVQPVDLRSLTGPSPGPGDRVRTFALTARRTQARLSSGATVPVLAYDGQVPGPELRVEQGDFVRVVLRNDIPDRSVTIHWHGLDVPNAEDGVPGLTQDGVRPGGTYTYQFRADQVGTYWYHSHQDGSDTVRMGLFGAIVVTPRAAPSDVDTVVLAHFWGDPKHEIPAFGTDDTLRRQAVPAGREVRLRVVNTDDYPMDVTLLGAPFQVAAIDGQAVVKPADLTGVTLPIAAGGRYDVTFRMPSGPVWFGSPGDFTHVWKPENAGILMSPSGAGERPPLPARTLFDPATYGAAAPVPAGLTKAPDRDFTVVMDIAPGFFDGQPNFLWKVNGNVYPKVPTLSVRQGDVVRMTLVNRSSLDHPMHLHGHHMLVTSRNGRAVTGSPWYPDTLNVAPGEVYEVLVLADNPGVWMYHCHNLEHAGIGMMLDLAYQGVTGHYDAGSASGNDPE